VRSGVLIGIATAIVVYSLVSPGAPLLSHEEAVWPDVTGLHNMFNYSFRPMPPVLSLGMADDHVLALRADWDSVNGTLRIHAAFKGDALLFVEAGWNATVVSVDARNCRARGIPDGAFFYSFWADLKTRGEGSVVLLLKIRPRDFCGFTITLRSRDYPGHHVWVGAA